MSFLKLMVTVILFCVSVATPLQAETQRTISTLTELGQAPFKGTSEQACQLLKEYDVSYLECISALTQCETEPSMFLEDGTILVTTSSSGNKHSAVTVKLLLTYPAGHESAGQPLPADHPHRAAKFCKQLTSNGITFVVPVACDNPSLALLTPPSPEPVPVVETPQTKTPKYVEVEICEDVLIASTPDETETFYSPRLELEWCDETGYILGGRSVSRSSGPKGLGRYEVCRTEWRLQE